MGALQWKSLITTAADRSGIPAALIAAVIEQESGGQPGIVNSAGAVGLMQVVQRFHPECGSVEDLKDPKTNVNCGCSILIAYNKLVTGASANWGDEGVVLETLACYNGGPGNVINIPHGRWPTETKQYIQDVNSLYARYADYFP